MKFTVECWNPACRRQFTAHDALPAAHDYRCPSCGMMAKKLVISKEQEKSRMPYYHLAEGTVMRVGLEQNHFRELGYYIRDPHTRLARKFDRIIANGSNKP